MLTELMTVSERIKKLREKAGLTQSELAKRVSLTRSAVNAWEMGSAIPSTEIVIKLAKLFKVSTDYLLGLDDEARISIKELSTKEIEAVQTIIDSMRDRR